MLSPQIFLCFTIFFSVVSAQSEGSCVGRCGQGYFRGDPCHCDYTCMTYMECCLDYKTVCTSEGSCQGRCHEGFIRGQTCDCDASCVSYGKCCPDYEEHCAKPVQKQPPPPPPPQLPDRDPSDDSPKPSRKPEERVPEPVPEESEDNVSSSSFSSSSSSSSVKGSKKTKKLSRKNQMKKKPQDEDDIPDPDNPGTNKKPKDKDDEPNKPKSPKTRKGDDDPDKPEIPPKEPDLDDKDGKPKKPKVKNGDDPEDPDPLPKERLPTSPKDEDDKPQKTKTSKVIENTEETEQDEDSPRKPLPSDKRKKNPTDNKPNKKKKVNPEDDADDESPKPGKGKKTKKKPSPKNTVKRKNKVDSEEERQETVSEFSSSSQSSSSHSRSKSIRRKTEKNKKNLKEKNKKKFPEEEEEPENPLMPPKKKYPLPTPVYTTSDEGSGEDGSGMNFLQTTIVSTTIRLNTTTNMATTVGTKNTEGTLKPSINPQTESINGSSYKTTTNIPIPESTGKQSAGSSATTVLYTQRSTQEEKTKELDTTMGTTLQQSKKNISIIVNGMDISATLLTGTPTATFNEESTKPAHNYDSTIEQQDMETKAKSTQDSFNNPVNMDMTTPYPGKNNGEKVEIDIGSTVSSETNSKVTTMTISPSHFDTNEKLNKEMITYSSTTKETTEQPSASTDQIMLLTSHLSNVVFSESIFKTTKNAYLSVASSATGSTEKAYSLHDEADTVNTIFPAGTAKEENINESKTTAPFSDKSTVSVDTTSASATQLAQTSIIMATNTNSKDSYNTSFTTEAKALSVTTETPQINQAVSTLHSTQAPLKDSTNTARSMDTTEKENIPQSTTVAEVTTIKEEHLPTTNDNRNNVGILTTTFTNLLYSTSPGEDKSVSNIFTIEQTSAKMDTIYTTLTKKQHSTRITLTEQTTTLSTPSLQPTKEQSTQQPPDTTLIKESSKPIKTVASTEKTEIPHTVTTSSAEKSSSASETSTLRQTPDTLHMTTDDLLIKKETNTEHLDIFSVTTEDKIKVWQTTDNTDKVSPASTIQENLTTLKEITESKHDNSVSGETVNELLPNSTSSTTSIESTTDKLQTTLQPKVETTKVSPVNEVTDVKEATTTFSQATLYTTLPVDHKTDLSTGESNDVTNAVSIAEIIKEQTDPAKPIGITTQQSAEKKGTVSHTTMHRLDLQTSQMQSTNLPLTPESETGVKPVTAEMFKITSLTTDISQKSILTSETSTSRQTVNLPETSQMPTTCHSGVSSTTAIDILKARLTTENINADQFPSTIQGKLLTSTEVTESEIINTVTPTAKISTKVPAEKEVTEREIYNTVKPTAKMSTEVQVEKEKVTENEIYNTVMPTTKMSTEVPVEKEVTESEMYNTVMPTTKMSTEVPVEKEVTENEIYNTVMPTTKMSTEVPVDKEQVTENEIYNTVMPTTKMSTEVPVEKEKVTENEIYNTVMPTTKMSTEVPVKKEEVTENEIYNKVTPTTKISTEVPAEKEVTENEIYNTITPTTKMSTEVPVDKEQVTENEIYNTVMHNTKMSTEVPVEKEVTENGIYNTVTPTTKMSTEVPVEKEKVTENEIYNTVMPTIKMSTEVPVKKEEVTENEIYNKVTPTTKISTEVPVEKEEVTENEIYNKVTPTTKMSIEVPVESSTIFVAKETATHNIDSIAVTKETSVSTLKTPQDQSTADSNAKHTTPRLEGTAVTTPGLEGTAVQHKSTPMGPTKHTPESGLTTTLSHSSPGKDTGTSPKTQSIDRSTNKINEYSTTSALFSTRNPNESQSQTSTNPTTRHADDIINKVSAETTTTGQSVKLTTRQPGIDQTSKQPGQRPIPDGGSSYEATTKQSPNAKTTSIPRHTTTTSNHKDSFTTMPINEDDIETNKATTPHTIHPHHICNLLKDEAIRLRIPESDLKLITEICAEMQQQYPNVNIPSSLQTRQPNIDEKKIPPEYPLSEGTPNIWYQQPGSKMIQIIEEIYRRINTSPTTNLTGIPGQDNHRSTAWLLLINKIKRATDPQMNLCIGPPADGMTTLQNGSMVVFRGHYFWTLNQGGVTGMPRKISEVWGIPSPIDTVFTRCNCGGKTFFFKGPRYWRFTNDAMDKGYPKEIIKGFGGLGGKVTAVLSVAGIKTRPESVYFFKPGGNVQKYTFRQEQTKRCTKKKQPSLNYPIYSQKVQTVKFRFPRDIVRHRIEIRRTFTNIPQPLGILHEERSIRSTWRGIPNNIVSAVSLPNPQKQDGFDYFVFTKDKYYNINMSSKVAIKPPPEAEQKTTKDFYKCKE